MRLTYFVLFGVDTCSCQSIDNCELRVSGVEFGCSTRHSALATRHSNCPVIIPRGPHPIPFRIRKLSPSWPMVLVSQGTGRVGSRRAFSFPQPSLVSAATADCGLRLRNRAARVPRWVRHAACLLGSARTSRFRDETREGWGKVMDDDVAAWEQAAIIGFGPVLTLRSYF